jgi:hypothetical protein
MNCRQLGELAGFRRLNIAGLDIHGVRPATKIFKAATMNTTDNNITIAVDSKIGHWRVLSIAHRRALCRCDCGNVREVAIAALADGTSTSSACAALSKNISNQQPFRLPDWRPQR